MAVQSRNCAAMLSYFIFFLSGLFFKHRQNCRMCETTNKGTCFCRCLFLVEMRGIDSRRELRALVSRGHDSPPDCRSVPRLLRSPSPLFCKKNKQKRGTCFSASTSFSGGDEGDRTPYLLNAIQALSRPTRKRTPHYTCNRILFTKVHRSNCNSSASHSMQKTTLVLAVNH